MLRFLTYQMVETIETKRIYEKKISSERIFFVNPPSFRSFGPFDKWGIRLFRIKKNPLHSEKELV